MQEIVYNIPGAALYFTRCVTGRETTAELAHVDGRVTELEVPALVEGGVPVAAIGRKALLGNGRLLKVTLPGGIRKIDDWAFAGCRRLREVYLPEAKLGKGVFQDCPALRGLYLSRDISKDVAALLSEAARHDVGYLLELERAGTAEWLRLWDAWLTRFLEQSDQEGYSGQVPCGEEDFGTSDVGAYESGRRREKAERSLLRLMHKEGLEDALRECLTAYIAEHTAGSEKGWEAWQMLLQKHPEEQEWYAAFAQAGGVTPANRDSILASIPEEYAEMKAYFIRLGQEGMQQGGLLAGLAL